MSECRAWSEGDTILEEYHDHEWCKINHDDDFQFMMLCLEGASVGLSWATKRQGMPLPDDSASRTA